MSPPYDRCLTTTKTCVAVRAIGAAARDFHNFNVVYPADPHTEVNAFTATQIPGIVARRYPASADGRPRWATPSRRIDALFSMINQVPADLAGTPIDLARLVDDRFVAIDKPNSTGTLRVRGGRGTRLGVHDSCVREAPYEAHVSRQAYVRVLAYADHVVCLDTPATFYGVGQFYREFAQVSDEEVVTLLSRPASYRAAS